MAYVVSIVWQCKQTPNQIALTSTLIHKASSEEDALGKAVLTNNEIHKTHTLNMYLITEINSLI